MSGLGTRPSGCAGNVTVVTEDSIQDEVATADGGMSGCGGGSFLSQTDTLVLLSPHSLGLRACRFNQPSPFIVSLIALF